MKRRLFSAIILITALAACGSPSLPSPEAVESGLESPPSDPRTEIQPTPRTPAPIPTTAPIPAPTLPASERIVLSDGSVAILDAKDKVAWYSPNEIRVAVEFSGYSFNLNFLPTARNWKESCAEHRGYFKTELQLRTPSDLMKEDRALLAKSAATATFTRKTETRMEELKRVLRDRNLDWSILLPMDDLRGVAAPIPSLVLQQIMGGGRDLAKIAEAVQITAQHGRPISVPVTIGEFCDLLSGQMAFGFQTENSRIILE